MLETLRRWLTTPAPAVHPAREPHVNRYENEPWYRDRVLVAENVMGWRMEGPLAVMPDGDWIFLVPEMMTWEPEYNPNHQQEVIEAMSRKGYVLQLVVGETVKACFTKNPENPTNVCEGVSMTGTIWRAVVEAIKHEVAHVE